MTFGARNFVRRCWVVAVSVLISLPLSHHGVAFAECINYAHYVHVVGGVETPDHAQAVALRGNLAYVADASSGLQVVDVSAPASPTIVGSMSTPARVRTIDIGNDDYAFLAHSASPHGLYVADISNPAAPMLAGTVVTPNYVEGVAVQGDFVYAAAGPSGLLVIDVSDPLNALIVGSATQIGYSFDVAVSGNYAYLVHSDRLLVIDVSVPTSPTILGRVDSPGVHSVTVAGSHAYVSRQSEVLVVDVANPALPQVVTTLPGVGGKVTVDGGRAYVGDGLYLEVFDVSYPMFAHSVGRLGVGVQVGESVLLGSHAFVTAGWTGVLAVATTDPEPSPVLGSGPMSGAHEFAAADGYLYAASGYSGLSVIDISDPISPVQIATLDAAWARGIDHAAPHVYLADDGAVLVIDVTNPAEPEVIRSVAMPSSVRDVAVSGTYVYAAATSSGVQVIDISNPALASVVGSVSVPGGAWGIAVEGGHAYVPGTTSFHVVDISNPNAPQVVGSVIAPGIYVSVSGGYACVTDMTSLHVVDLANPVSPELVGSFDTASEYAGVLLQDGIAYVGDGTSGLRVIDILDPAGPQVLGAEYSASYGTSVLVDGRVFSSGSRGAGAEVIVLPSFCDVPTSLPDIEELQGSRTRPQLLAPYPNPARDRVTIPLTLARGQSVRLSVHDAAGRLVTRLVDGWFSGSRVVWSGLNVRGQRMAAGIYLLRLETPAGIETRKLVLQH